MFVMLLGKAGRAALQPLQEPEARSQPSDEIDDYVCGSSMLRRLQASDNGTRPDVPGNIESLLAFGGHRVSFVYPSFKDLNSWLCFSTSTVVLC
jgi:hypothetical protein